jgi:hypothetical protein
MKLLAILFILSVSLSAQAADVSPVSEGASTLPNEESAKSSELKIHLGNESNAPDGLLGPYTYGLRARHQFKNEISVEAGYIRLHEPGLPVFESALDEAQLTAISPDTGGFVIAATLWKNRIVDMYTSLAGLEVTRAGSVSLTAGLYLGNADREEERGNFRGAQLAVGGNLSRVDLSLGCLFGQIDRGSYRKASLEASVDLPRRFPSTVSMSIEERFFDFANGGSKIDPIDKYIFVASLEFSIY